jgi:hypothetical protein
VAKGFSRSRRGIRAKFDDHEKALLAHLFVEVYELLDDQTAVEADPLAAMVGIGTAVKPPADPALARLLPDGHRDDPEASAEFRRYTEVGLRQRKRTGLETARRTLGRSGVLLLDDSEAQAWVVALTDVRLVLAERMGLRTDDDHERLMDQVMDAIDARDEVDTVDDVGDRPSSDLGGDPASDMVALEVMLSLYDFLTWLQETLVAALVAPMTDPPA